MVVYEPHMGALLSNLVTSVVAFVSQVAVILIANGLEGNFSGKTLMWVQAVCEMVKRVLSMLLLVQPLTGRLYSLFNSIYSIQLYILYKIMENLCITLDGTD